VSQVGATDGQAQLDRRIDASGRWPAVSDLAVYAGVALCLLGGLLLFYGSYYSIHHDLAGNVLSGRLAATLGSSFGDYALYFPPSERAWFSLASRLADLTGLRLDLTIVLMSGTAVLFAASLAYRIRRQTVGASPLFLVLSVLLLVVLPILFKNVFGMREHLVVLGLWPYLVLRVSDPDGTRIGWQIRLLVGLWMGATLLIKYLYSIVVLLVEIADAAVQRRPALLFRIENIASGAVVAVYLFVWLVLDASQRTAIGAVLSAIDANLDDPRTNWLKAANHLALSLFFVLAFRIFQVPKRATLIGFALVLGTVIAAWTQERWYSHHLFPITMAYIAWWWMVGRSFRWWGHAVVAICLIAPIATQFISTGQHQQKVAELDLALGEAGQSVAGKRVGILTMHPSPYNQYLASHGATRWNSSANNAYVAAELKPLDQLENAGATPPPVKLDDPGRRMLHDEMLRLWEDMPPDVLILDHSTRWPLSYLDVEWKHVFSEDARFNAILAHYRPVVVHRGEWLEFRYYVRADEDRDTPTRTRS
jgi:hypothetical protein